MRAPLDAASGEARVPDCDGAWRLAAELVRASANHASGEVIAEIGNRADLSPQDAGVLIGVLAGLVPAAFRVGRSGYAFDELLDVMAAFPSAK